MKVRLHNKSEEVSVEVPYDDPRNLPTIIYRFVDGAYKFYRQGYAYNSTTYYETEALHVPV